MEITGRNLISGLPKTVTISSNETIEAFREPLNLIMEKVHSVLERTPPELAADIAENGICMTGGGAMLYGLIACWQSAVKFPAMWRMMRSPAWPLARARRWSISICMAETQSTTISAETITTTIKNVEAPASPGLFRGRVGGTMEELYSPKVISGLLEKYGLAPLKKLGQNFLRDENVVNKIAEAAVLPGENVLEIGPGLGVLTALSPCGQKKSWRWR